MTEIDHNPLNKVGTYEFILLIKEWRKQGDLAGFSIEEYQLSIDNMAEEIVVLQLS